MQTGGNDHFPFGPADIYIFKVNNRNTRTRYERCSKLTIKTPERRHWRSSSVFVVNFEQVNVAWGRFNQVKILRPIFTNSAVDCLRIR